MRRGGGGHSDKMNAHVWLLEPFKRWGLRFLFCKHKLTRFFSARKQMFFLGWGRGVAYGEGDGERHYSDKGPTSFVAILRLLNLVTEFTPVTTILFFCWVRYVTKKVRQKLSWKRQPYRRKMKTSSGNFKTAAILPWQCYYGDIFDYILLYA